MPHSVNHADTMAATATLEAHAVPATTTPASPVEPVAALVADVDALTIDGAKAASYQEKRRRYSVDMYEYTAALWAVAKTAEGVARVALQTANSDSSLTSSEATPDKEIPQSFNLPLA